MTHTVKNDIKLYDGAASLTNPATNIDRFFIIR